MPRFIAPRSFHSALAALGALLGVVSSAHAQFNFATFPNTTGLSLASSANPQTLPTAVNNRLRVTTNAGGQIGAAWYTVPQSVAQGFSTTFVFSINNSSNNAPNGGDGFAFLIQNSSATAVTASGGGCTLGYDGIPNSIALEFDTYQTGGACVGAGNVSDPNGNHVSLHTMGTAPNSVMESASLGVFTPGANMEAATATTHTVQVVYVPGTITVFYDTVQVITAPLNLYSTLNIPSGTAWVGFTAATGGAYERHEIISWSFTPSTTSLPTGLGSLTPNPIVAGTAGVVSVAVTPASGASSAITSAAVNGSSIGLSSSIALNDSGTGGDAAASDNIWSASVMVPFATTAGAKSLPFALKDVQGRNGTGNLVFTVNAPAPGDDRRPVTPTITEPALAGQILNASDVHMVTANMVSPVAAGHLCTDWEIRRSSDNALVWFATCASEGALKVHIHFADGTFTGPYAGRSILEYDINYQLRVRHRDDSGDPVSEYSYWASRNFKTAPPTAIFPYEESDLLSAPIPTWQVDAAGPVILPVGASLVLGSAQDDLLLRIDGTANGNQQTNPGELPAHINVRVNTNAGPSPLNIGPSTITVVDPHCGKHFIYLPAISLAAGGQAYYWVTSSGSTYVAAPAATTPVFTTLARGTLSPWEIRQPGYVVEQFSSNFRLPVNIAFVPNPGPAANDIFFYVTELYGQIKVVRRNGVSSDYAANLLNFTPSGLISGSGECGVAGICVEPTTGDLFVTKLRDTGGGALRPIVVRMHSTDGGYTMDTETPVLDGPLSDEPQGQSHQISNISIGPDGKLYVHNGDGFDQTKGRDLRYLRGKILRMELDGSPCTDNPFYTAVNDGAGGGLGTPSLMTNTPSAKTKLIWAYGVRNPFGGAWRASDGKHFTIENGPSNDRLSISEGGKNYLYDGSDTSMNNFNILGVSTAPLVAAWYPAHGPVNGAFIETATFNGSGFPPAKMDHLYVTESGPTYAQGAQSLGKRISEFVVAPNTGALVSGPAPLVEYTGTGFASCVAIAAGPDGLYFSDMYVDQPANPPAPVLRGSNILRVRYVGVSGTCPPCPADFNGINGVNVADIFAFLSAWFAGDPRADFNGFGGINVADIFAFLSAWFAPC